MIFVYPNPWPTHLSGAAIQRRWSSGAAAPGRSTTL